MHATKWLENEAELEHVVWISGPCIGTGGGGSPGISSGHAEELWVLQACLGDS